MKDQHGKSPVKTVVRKWQAGRIAGFEINPRIADRLSCGFQIDVGKITPTMLFTSATPA